MIKATKPNVPTAPLVLTPADIALVAGYLTNAGDAENMQRAEQIKVLQNNTRENEERNESRQRDINENNEMIESNRREIDQLERDIRNMPPARQVPPSEAQSDLVRAAALSYIKSIAIEQITIDGTERPFIVATTRANSLFTTLDRKYSRAERWYKVKPYKIPLPAYNIRIGLTPSKTLAQNANGLVLALADHAQDTAHFLPWIHNYTHEPHAHWGTTSASEGQYRAICLGEYESEVSSAFKKSIAEGIAALAIYLQTAGSEHAYVTARERWALRLGKAEYNRLMIPSEKEVTKLTEADSDSCDDCNDSDGRTCDDDCSCDCHNE